jgi:hypothetical protein
MKINFLLNGWKSIADTLSAEKPPSTYHDGPVCSTCYRHTQPQQNFDGKPEKGSWHIIKTHNNNTWLSTAKGMGRVKFTHLTH